MTASRVPYGLRRAVADVFSLAPPNAVIESAAAIARVRQLLRPRWLAPSQLRELFDGFPVSDSNYRAVAQTIAGYHGRRVALRSIVERRGVGVAAALLDGEGLDAIERLARPARPVVVMTCHFGAPAALAAAFVGAHVRALAIHGNRSRREPSGTQVIAVSDERKRTSALWQAVHWLRENGLVAIAADGGDGERTAAVPCLGRLVRFGRGAFAMARLGGAEIVPAVGLWTPAGRIRLQVGQALSFVRGETPEAFETNGAAAFAKWYEDVMLANPTQVRVEILRRLLAADRVASERSGRP